jgi:hypothetical protein
VNLLFTDPFGTAVKIDDTVFFAGKDQQRKPTINRGTVEEINIADRKVCVLRDARSGNATVDSAPRRVWVEVSKIAVVLP